MQYLLHLLAATVAAVLAAALLYMVHTAPPALASPEQGTYTKFVNWIARWTRLFAVCCTLTLRAWVIRDYVQWTLGPSNLATAVLHRPPFFIAARFVAQRLMKPDQSSPEPVKLQHIFKAATYMLMPAIFFFI